MHHFASPPTKVSHRKGEKSQHCYELVNHIPHLPVKNFKKKPSNLTFKMSYTGSLVERTEMKIKSHK
jgi:hypothetical protein